MRSAVRLQQFCVFTYEFPYGFVHENGADIDQIIQVTIERVAPKDETRLSILNFGADMDLVSRTGKAANENAIDINGWTLKQYEAMVDMIVSDDVVA